MGERPSRISRRSFILTGLTAASVAAIETACGTNGLNVAPFIPRGEELAGPTQRLRNQLSSEIIRILDLGKLADTPATYYKLPNTDRPTHVYQYHKDISFDPVAAKAVYDTTNQKSLPDLVEALKQDKRPFDPTLDPKDPQPIRYDYLPNQPPIGIGVFSSNPVVRERHTLIVPDNLKTPLNDHPFHTNHLYINDSQVLVTIINPDRVRSSQEVFELNRGFSTETYQQTLIAIAFKLGKSVAQAHDMEALIAQEGLANGLGYASALRIQGESWNVAEKKTSTALMSIPGLPPIFPFTPTEKAYQMLPTQAVLQRR